jgi:hypothetical protein
MHSGDQDLVSKEEVSHLINFSYNTEGGWTTDYIQSFIIKYKIYEGSFLFKNLAVDEESDYDFPKKMIQELKLNLSVWNHQKDEEYRKKIVAI